MDIEKKEKVKNIIKNVWLGISTFLSVCFVVVCAVACSSGSKQQTNNNSSNNVNEVVKQENKKQVVYNDELYLITFSDEDFNYTYENLFNALLQYDDETFLQNNNVRINDYAINYLSFGNNQLNFEDTDNSGNLYVLTGINNSYEVEPYIFYSGDETIWEIIFNLEPQVYSTLKNAIELDLQPKDIIGNGGIFENMTNSITAFIGSLSSGITAMVGIFYSNGALTIIGLLSVIVVAISLAYFLFRLFIGLIRMRG